MRDCPNVAWVTFALHDEDVPNALTLSCSLKRVLTTKKLAVMASSELSALLKQALHFGFDFVFYLQDDLNTSGLPEIDFVKLSALTLASFRKMLFLSPESMVLRNCDELFDNEWNEDEDEKKDFRKEENEGSIFLAKPSLITYNAVLEAIQSSNGLTKKFLQKHMKILQNVKVISIGRKTVVGNETDLSIINLENISKQKLSSEIENYGLIGKIVLKQWKEIEEDYVQPLLKQQQDHSPLKEDVPFSYEKEPIAIVGMSCRYPGANNLEEFWKILVNGEDAIGNPPEFRWLKEQCSRPLAGSEKTKAGFLKCPVDEFDAKFFGITPKEVVFLDPQHRLLHELVWEGLEDAAVNPQELRGTNGGVFIGSWLNRYKDIVEHDGNKDFYRTYMGNSIGAAAARISFLLGMTGPSIATESGCSSAMVAVHLACRSLQLRETNFAFACGVNLLLHPFDKDTVPMFISPDGHCKTFDANANGFARAEGCGVLVLKRLSDAVRDGDKIWALIRGSAMTQEGISRSMGTPTVHCESLAMKQALKDARVDPAQVSYVEAHGTGTVVGDPLEVAAIAKAYRSGDRKEPLLIGSVKTNVGHTESCSGITGIMKVVLGMKHEIIAPHRNFETLNPAIDLDAVPAKIPLKPVEWKRHVESPRLAGVSSFGITGTDAHAIIEEAPILQPNPLISTSTPERPFTILKISAKTEEALTTLLEKYKSHLQTIHDDFKDLTFSANVGRADFSHRAVIIAKSNDDAVISIEKNKLFKGEADSLENFGKICFLFTGQGSQYHGMGQQLYKTSPIFRMHFEYCEKILMENYNIDIGKCLWSEADFKGNEMSKTINSQLSIFCVEYSLLKLWESWGIKADFALGHSLGEFVAAVSAGILNIDDAIKLVAERSRLIDQLPRGKMLVIKANKQEVDTLMNKFAGNNQNKMLDYAAINSNEQTVVAGDVEVVLQFGNFCKENGLKNNVLEASHAFHSRHMDPMLNEYREVAKTIKNPKGIENGCKFISGMRGTIVNADQVDAEYWVEHTREKVMFLEASKKAVEVGCKIFIEVGPQPILSALTMMNNDTPLLCLPSLKKTEGEWETMLNTLGKLYVKGMEINWKGLDAFCTRKKVQLPHYPFIGKKYWPDLVATSGSTIHPLLGTPISNASSAKLFQVGLNLRDLEYVKDHAIGDNIIFPGAGYLEMCLAAGLATVEGSTSSLSSPTRAMKVENLLIEAPLSLLESHTCKVQTVVELNENEGDGNDMKVSIFRRVESDPGKWLSHAKATFSPISTPQDKAFQFDLNQFKETLKQPSNDGELSQIYDKLASVGLKFGPIFRSIQKIWRNNNTLLAKVKVPSESYGQSKYIIHPVVLDAMIQALMILHLHHSDNIKTKLYVPIKIGKFVWFQEMTPSTSIYIHVSHSPNPVALLISSSSGAILASMSSVELIDTTVKAIDSVLEQQTISMPDMWEEIWRSEMGPLQYRVDLKKSIETEYSLEFWKLMSNYENLPSSLADTFSQLEHLSYLYFLKAFYDCGWNPTLGEIFDGDELQKGLKIQPNFRQYFRFILEALEMEGVLEKKGENLWNLKAMPPTLNQVVTQLSSPSITKDLVSKFPPTLLFSKYGENLAPIFRGQGSALSILFPEENKGYPSVFDFYQDYGEIFLLKESGCLASRSRFATISSAMKDQRFVLRILEVGAGTGSYSSNFIECLDEQGIEFEYTYTDISSAFFPAAQKKFEKYGKQMKFKKLNIEEDPLKQGFSPEYFDYVYVAEVIHATRDIRETLRNIRMLMKPFGKMDIIDQTRENRIITYLFGALDGFWRFQDFDIRKRHCTICPQKWGDVFAQTGFTVDAVFPVLFGYHSLMGVHKTEEVQVNFIPQLGNKTWLLFDEKGCQVSEYLRTKLEESVGRKVFSVRKDTTFQQGDKSFGLRSWREEDFNALFTSMKTRGLEVEGIVYCWALNKEITSQDEILQPYFYLTKTVLTLPAVNPRIVAVTNGGTVPLGENDMSHFHASTLWGFTKSLRNENMSINCCCVELINDPGEEMEAPIKERRLEELFCELWNFNKGVQVAFSGGNRLTPRLITHKVLTNALQLPKGTDKFQLILPASKTIADLQFGPLELGNLKENEVEIQVKASALNFRDLLSVIKPTEQFKDINAVGFDLAGVVKKVGRNVRKWKLGDRVCGCNIKFTAMPSHLVLGEDLLLQIPDNMTDCDAATIPAVYVTSVVCLIETAKIKKGDVVLIHAATGGVGLSAIEICKHVGCTVIATAGSKRKRNYLRSLGIQHIFHSRNTNYGDQIQELTNGRGVDVVLNSLTSEGFKEATLKACGKGARFVEMSKLNIWKPEEVKELRPDVNYSIVDISNVGESEWNRLMGVLEGLMDKGVVKPIPYVRFDGQNVREALQYMQKAKHIGKIVCVMPEVRKEGGEMKIHTPMFNKNSTYLITGGLGGIGFVVCKWMVEQGAKHVVLAGRNPPSHSIETEIKTMNSTGANVIPVQLDVGNFEKVKDLIDTKIRSLGLPPLRGIMHAAGTLSDGVILNQDWPKLSSTFTTKINGTMNLHELTKYLNLEHFVMFSSMASVLGPPGQCNHAAGNCFEDAICHYRHSMGLPATTINWGQWGQVGIATEVDLPGVRAISNLHGLKGLEYALKMQRVQSLIFNIRSFLLFSKLLPHISEYVDERIWKKTTISGITSITIKSDEFWQKYESAKTPEEKSSVLKEQLRNIVRNTLKLDENEEIGDDVDMQEMGLDSLMFVEIKNGLQTLLGDRLSVSASTLKDANTINLITSALMNVIKGEGMEDPQHHSNSESHKPTMEEVNKLMREDSLLPEHIRPKPEQKVESTQAIKTVLLTGSTGTLGPYILKELTNLPQVTQVVCLIRPSKTSVEERLTKILRGLEILSKVDMRKVRCVPGNIAEPHLGLDPEAWSELSQKVDAIIHLAACILHTQQYQKISCKNDMRAVNIGGTKNVLEFACENKLKYVFHASSFITAVTIDEKSGRISEEWPKVEDFENVTTFGYPVTKFVADVLIAEAVKRGIPAKIFRFPLISGDSSTGRCSIENNHVLLRFLFAMKKLIMESNQLPLVMLPVDSCAQVSIKIFFENEAPFGVYNIFPFSPNVEQEFVGVAKRFGYHVELVDFTEFHKRVIETRESGKDFGLSMFQQFYSGDDVIVSFFNTSLIRRWIDMGGGEESNFWRSSKVEKFAPGFYEGQENTMELLYKDLSFLKRNGWFDKFGL